MFNDDDDYSFLTGGLGDLDGDGRVDFEEYMIEEDDFQRIMGSNDDGYSFSDDDNDDWETVYLDTANEYGLDVYDYADKEEFLEALSEAKENAEWRANREIEALEHGLNLDDFDDEDEFEEALEELEEDSEEDELDEANEKTVKFNEINSLIQNDYSVEVSNISDEYVEVEKYIRQNLNLKNQNKALKSKITQLNKQITDLNCNIRRLEADLEAKRKSQKKEWDGKYYLYCQVRLDESPRPLWYRTNDITLKKNDYVLIPYGYKNEEMMGIVVSVEEYRSDDLPFPLEKTKFIIEKCEE